MRQGNSTFWLLHTQNLDVFGIFWHQSPQSQLCKKSAGVNLSSYRSAREKCDQRSPANPQVKRHWDEVQPQQSMGSSFSSNSRWFQAESNGFFDVFDGQDWLASGKL